MQALILAFNPSPHPFRLTPRAARHPSKLLCSASSPPAASPRSPTRRLLLGALLATALLPPPARARPHGLPQGAADAVLPATFPPSWPYTAADFTRFDPQPDDIFYSTPRLVRHIDAPAQAALRAYYARILQPSTRDVLDICSSVEAYLPPAWPARRRVTGLGMNATELEANPALTDYVVHNLNVDPKLPYGDASFDLVLCALSIDYLTKPREVLAEVARVLRPGGRVELSFSDRVFGTKAVSVWMSGSDEDHIYITASFLHYAGGFSEPKVVDLSPRRSGVCSGDPLYVVEAKRIA